MATAITINIFTAGKWAPPLNIRFSMEWDAGYGKKTQETDENRQTIYYQYDGYGRLARVWSPYDRYGQNGAVAAVSYLYETGQGNWYAVTENKVHFSADDTQTLTTVIMVDGLGRALYTAKQGAVWEDGTVREGWNVSEFTAYDVKGRSIASGQPEFVRGGAEGVLLQWPLPAALKNATEQRYDSLDRVIETKLPAAAGKPRPTQTTAYAIREGKSWTITIDPLGNVSEQGADGRGNIVAVRRLGVNQTAELTQAGYEYNGLGEMLKALDADNNPLKMEYDRLGRRKKMTSADIGTKEWWYDAAGNVIMEADSELTRRGKRIRYHYDGLNRLIKIEYPFSTATEYTYGEYSGTARGDLAAGRVTKLSDESGTIEYRYGLLGQVEEERRTIKLLPLSGGQSKTVAMKYTSDYLGRMEKIEYPDGEVVEYGYDYGGQITRVTGTRNGTEFPYVKETGYDEYGQRIYIEYGSGVKSRYEYDPFRRWLSKIVTESPVMGNKYQEIAYEFDDVGNVLGYENTSFGHTTSQRYQYGGLYQLTEARGQSRSHPNGLGGHTEYNTDYRQQFMFNAIGNMTGKVSTENVSNTNRIGMNLNYNLDYEYYAGTHKAERIGNRYYDYDLNGNLVAEKEGSHAVVQPDGYMPYGRDGDLYYTDYGFGLVKPGNKNNQDDGTFQRDYKWNERNLLSESRDSAYTVQYRYGADGQRALKYVTNSGRATVYFNKMWQTSNGQAEWLQGKHVYVGEDRLATKYNSEGNENTQAEQTRVYYYHSDHLGSAQVVTNHRGQIHERLEYTPYGELWIDWRSDDAPEDGTPYRFTGKELDAETGLYYYGARYLDPKTSRWLSGDPALGEYIPSAPVNEEAKKRNGNLPGQGGVFNYVNLHVYHYAGNNPVKYTDPDGRIDRNYLNKGSLKIAGGYAQISAGKALRNAGYASIFVNPAAPAIIDQAEAIIAGGEEKVEIGKAIIDRAWTADSIGKGHAYKNHAQTRNEFAQFGITGDNSIEDQEKLVSLTNTVLEDPTEHKPNKNSGNEMYLDEKNDIIVIVDPKRNDKGTVFRPSMDTQYPQSARSYYDSN